MRTARACSTRHYRINGSETAKLLTRYQILLLLLACASTVGLACSVSGSSKRGVAGAKTIVSQTVNSPAPNGTPQETQDANGLYFGSTQENGALVAWLVYLNSKEGKGSLYLPPRIIKLSSVEIRSGTLTFRMNYEHSTESFDGVISGSAIKGSFRYSAGKVYEVTLDKVDPKALPDRDGVSGLYTNVYYSEQTGDLVGSELLLISDKNRLIGVFTPYEGVPGEKYALVDAAVVGNRLHFKIQNHRGQVGYSGNLSAGRLVLKRDADDDGESSVLPKRNTVVDVMNGIGTIPPRRSSAASSSLRALSR